MTTAIGYARVSTVDQAKEGVSLDAQEAKIRAYCSLNDLELVGIEFDDESGKSVDRPGLQAALDELKSGAAQAIVVLKLDRLSRRVRDTLDLVEEIELAGAAFHSIAEHIDTKSAMGRFFLTIMAALAQMERETIVERTVTALQHKKATGQHIGGVPFGYRCEKVGNQTSLVRDQSEQVTLMFMVGMRAGGAPYQAIADALNEAGTKPPRPLRKGRETRWHSGTVQTILMRVPEVNTRG